MKKTILVFLLISLQFLAFSQQICHISVILNTTNPTPCAYNNGNITAHASGGAKPYTYLWSPGGGTDSVVSGLSAGTYTVFVTDSNGCGSTTETLITPAVLNIALSSINLACHGSNTGNVSATVIGGVTPYTYLWTGGKTTASISGLSAGTYTLNVVDSAGCSTTASVTITQPLTSVSVAIKSHTNPTCNGGTGIAIADSATGGTPSYTYQWTPSGGTNLTATGLNVGTYTITATDANGCSGTARIAITQPAEIKVNARASANVSCYGLSDASIYSTITGGTPPYTYLWSGGATTSSVSGLSAGTYTLEVWDQVSCALAKVTITQPSVLNATTFAIKYISCNGLNNGEASVNASGGTTSYKYVWSNAKTTDTIKNLISGTYSVTVTDRHGCTTTANVIITQPATLITNSSVITNVSCNGLINGSAFATTSGGTGYPYDIITVGGNGTADSIGDGTPAIFASINTPEGITVDKAGNIYIADLGNNKIRKINKAGIITTIAGTGIAGYNGDGILATSAFLSGPLSVAVDDSGNVFIADATNQRIRKVNKAGIISTITGDGLPGNSGDGNLAINAEVNSPGGVAVDDSGNVYIGDTQNNKIRKINKNGIINTIAGNGAAGFGGDGFAATAAQLNFPQGVAVDDSGNVFIADLSNGRVRKVNASGIINTFAGTGTFGYNGDSIQATTAELYTPKRVAVDDFGNVYIADEFNNRIRKVNSLGIISTIAGTGIAGYNGDYINADSAELNNPIGVAVDDSGNIYIGDKLNERIREVLPAYNYLWTPGNLVGQKIYNLSAATYTVTVTDVNGCSATSSATITQPNILSASTTISNITCNGLNNGSASTTINGGTTPYTYSWTNSGTTSAISGLSQGTYSLTVLDINGCSITQSVTITQPTPLNVTTSVISNVDCYRNANGGASSSVSGGTTPYTYLWTGGSTTTSITGLTASTYILSVTDGNGCVATSGVTITQPATPVSVTITAEKNIDCYGNATGWVTASAPTGGTPTYLYIWTPGGDTTLHVSGLRAGTYTIIVIDAHRCIATDTITLEQPFPLIANPAVLSNVSCNNGNNGSAILNVSGGTLPYTYAWSNSGTTSIQTGLSAGTYSVEVTDNNGCSATASVTITQPSVLSVSANVTSTISCNGGSGSAASIPNGGTTPYTYLWSNSQTTANVNGLSEGTYTITVTDSCGSQATANVNITQPNPLVVSIATQNNVLCNGGTGDITANMAIGGTPPYSYSWSPSGGTNTSATGLSAGTYSITVKDANGCSSNASAILTQPATLLGSSAVSTNASCYASNDGSAFETASGGTTPYTYSWSNSLTTSNVSGLTAGSYTVTVKDFHGCIKIDSVNITQPSLLTVLAKATKNVNCNDSASGSVLATPSGGTLPYTYSWAGLGNNAAESGLTAGSYSVTITDNNGCTTTSTAFVKQTTAFNILRDSLFDNGTCTGFAAVEISGGTQPYTFLWTPGNQTTDSIYGLCAGVYCCKISDSNNCQEYICMTIKTAVGIANIKNDNTIAIYPDPNTGYFSITGLSPGQVVELYNYLGQKLSGDIADNATMHFNISSQANGVYLVRIRNKDGSYVFQKKIVKTQ